MKKIELVQGICAMLCIACTYAVVVNGDSLDILSFPMGLSLSVLLGATLWSVVSSLNDGGWL